MSGDGGRLPDDTPSDPERSGPTVQEGVDEAAAGSGRADGVLRPPEESAPGTAPVEQVADDPAMTEGRSDRGARPPGAEEGDESAPVEETPVSGGMQSDPGARAADRQAGAPQPSDMHDSGRDD